MTIAIGGWVLMVCASSTPCVTLSAFVHTGAIVRGFDTAEACEWAHNHTSHPDASSCVPALALVYR